MILDTDSEYMVMTFVIVAFIAFLAIQIVLYSLIKKLCRNDAKFEERFGKDFNPLALSWNDQKQIMTMIRESANKESNLESKRRARNVILLYRFTSVALGCYVLVMLILIVLR